MAQSRLKLKDYKLSLVDKLPMNLKMIEISPMTKAMCGMVVSVLAIAEYLDSVYWFDGKGEKISLYYCPGNYIKRDDFGLLHNKKLIWKWS